MSRVNTEILVPEQVRSATFASARFGHRGFDEGEVHAFCERIAEGLNRLRNDNNLLQAEIARLRERVLGGTGRSGAEPEDGHIQAVHILSKAQQTADRYVADAQDYSRELAQDARMRRDEILREAKMRASMILEEAHASGGDDSDGDHGGTGGRRDPLTEAERRDLQTEVAYLRTFSDVCRTHLRAYLESLGRSIEEWERAERAAARHLMKFSRSENFGNLKSAKVTWHLCALPVLSRSANCGRPLRNFLEIESLRNILTAICTR